MAPAPAMHGFKADDGTHRRYFFSQTRTDTCELSTSCVTGGCLTQYYWSSGCSSHNCDDDGGQARAIWTNKAQNQRAGMSNNCTLNFNALGVCTERGYG